jgi:putative restriction endonuclease
MLEANKTAEVTTFADSVDSQLRAAMFAHLDRLRAANPSETLSSRLINTFVFEDRPVRLIAQTGIWKPASLKAALTIRTTYTPPDALPPYVDAVGDDGFVRYKYRGTDPSQSDNRALRAAMQSGLPLAYSVGVGKGVYFCHYPVWLKEEDVRAHAFVVALDEDQRALELSRLSVLQRAYVARLTMARLHQPVFRARVLHAYGERCAICRLHHVELLDAAHIIPDGEPSGEPVVPNGLSLCKIHHAAYDSDLIGVRPDLVVDIRPQLLLESDGPMLRHGLQEMSGIRLTVPNSRAAQPDPERLEVRYERFKAAS